MNMRIITVMLPENVTKKVALDLIKFAIDDHYSKNNELANGEAKINFSGIDVPIATAPCRKSQQELFEEILESALTQFKAKIAASRSRHPELMTKSTVEQFEYIIKNNPSLLETLINAGITGNKDNNDILVKLLSKHTLWELPFAINMFKKD